MAKPTVAKLANLKRLWFNQPPDELQVKINDYQILAGQRARALRFQKRGASQAMYDQKRKLRAMDIWHHDPEPSDELKAHPTWIPAYWLRQETGNMLMWDDDYKVKHMTYEEAVAYVEKQRKGESYRRRHAEEGAYCLPIPILGERS